MTAPEEARFHDLLFTRLTDHISENETPFADPVSEKITESGFADIYLPRPLNDDLVIEVKRDDIYPREFDGIKQARDYASEIGVPLFATCNSNDLFLFYYQDEHMAGDIEFYYFDLREQQLADVIPQFLGVVEHVYEHQELPPQTERERLVGILRSFHSSIWPSYEALAWRKYERNEAFTQAFDEWVRENDYADLDRDDQFSLAAKQYAYLFTNKILFYEVVREKTTAQHDPQTRTTEPAIKTESGFPLDPLADYTTIDNLERHLDRQFDAIVSEIDYEPISDDGSSLFAQFPQATKTLRTLDDFITNIESEQITELNEDILGEIYQELIPVAERKALGQFYTHPKIAETICKWTIQRPNNGTTASSTEQTNKAGKSKRADGAEDETQSTDRLPTVLDPASGSGTFPVEAYKRLSELAAGDRKVDHQTLIDHIAAVDINRFPLHLTALNLASQDIRKRTNQLHVFNDSFFNINPDTDRLIDSRIQGARGDSGRVGQFDAVVGNPPYIRQESLYPDREHFRSHLSVFGRSGSAPYKDGSKHLSKRSDAYVYFVTHATQFLRENGRLGFIMPTKWLTTRYGESFQGFLYDHYQVQAVVGFSARAFEDALVDTALLMLERCSDEEARRENTINFVRIKERIDVEDIVSTLDFGYQIPDDSYMLARNRKAYRTVAVEQDYLMDASSQKLSPYLAAPVEFISLLEHPALIDLDELGDIHRGVMTGSNAFFFLDEEDLQTWSIDERFLTPAIKSIRDVDEQVLTEADTDRYVFDIHEYVEQLKHDTTGVVDDTNFGERIKDALSRDGYDKAKRYVEWGESEGFHERRSCAARAVWFDLGDLEKPEILHPKFFDERVFVIWNRDRLVASNAVDCVSLDADIDEAALMGVLNSTVNRALLECWGRAEGGGALQLMTYEVSSLPVVDVRALDEDAREAIVAANQDLIEGVEGAQDRLDRSVVDALGFDIDVVTLQELWGTMAKQRVRSGDEVEVLVKRMESLEMDGTQTFAESDDGTTN